MYIRKDNFRFQENQNILNQEKFTQKLPDLSANDICFNNVTDCDNVNIVSKIPNEVNDKCNNVVDNINNVGFNNINDCDNVNIIRKIPK